MMRAVRARLYPDLKQLVDVESNILEIIEIYLKLVKQFSKVLGHKHPDTIMRRMELGAMYNNSKRFPEAEDILLRAYMDSVYTLNREEYRNLHVCFPNMGHVYDRPQRYADAAYHFHRTWTIPKKIFGDEH